MGESKGTYLTLTIAFPRPFLPERAFPFFLGFAVFFERNFCISNFRRVQFLCQYKSVIHTASVWDPNNFAYANLVDYVSIIGQRRLSMAFKPRIN